MRKTDQLKKLQELEEAVTKREKSSGDIPPIFPTFNVSYGLDGEKKKNVGLALGSFFLGGGGGGGAFGGSLYFLGSFLESLYLGVSIDAVHYVLDTFLAQQARQLSEDVKLTNGITTGLRALVVYEF